MFDGMKLKKKYFNEVNEIMNGNVVVVGTGKSRILQRICKELAGLKVKCALTATTATTGMAANVIGGSTLHRFLGITDPSLTANEQSTVSVQDNFVRQRLL